MAEKKAIWGSARYFIKIDPFTNVFSTSMSGVVSFFDTHGLINEKECNNLQELVRTVLDFWSTILAPHETRVARWIEEYLSEINIVGNYNLLLRLLRADEALAEDLDDLIKDTKSVATEVFETAFEIPEDTKIIGHEITISRLPEDEYLRNELVKKLLEDNKYQVPSTVESRYQFKLANGDVISTKKENTLGIGETQRDVTLLSGIENEYDEPITEVEIVDEIPYYYEIENMGIENLEIGPSKEKKEKVLKVIWKIPEIQPKEKVEINYKLAKRISRTILEIIQNEVIAVLNTFEKISVKGLEFLSQSKYINIHNRPLHELHIIDEIPPEFNIIRTNPEALPPTGIIEKAKLKNINIQWKQKNVSANQTLEKIYTLDYFPYLFRGKKIIQNDEGKTIFKIAKFIMPSEREIGYKILFIIKNIKSEATDIISIMDRLPADHAIVGKKPEESQIMEQIDDQGDKIATWIVEPPSIGKTKRLEILVSGDTPPMFEMFKVFIGDKEEKEVIEKETTVTREMVKSP
ncbi:MAG: hypothetical protein KGD64_02645 [Candidatus Heimdallarchaeota archaeon]|nr:hypothetical protein [Candidatus Heimdallarchaeota archaeon]